eukprot:c25123_g2_i2 orf=655-1899(+)
MLLSCSSVAEMEAMRALQTPTLTHNALLESVTNLRPLLSAVLQNHGGESSFIRQQQEHEHTLHHGNQVPNDGQGQDRECGHHAHAHSDGHGQDRHGHDAAHGHTDGNGHDGPGNNEHGHEHEHDHSVHTVALGMSTDDSDSNCSSAILDLIEQNKRSTSLLETQAAGMAYNCGGGSIEVPSCITAPLSSSSMIPKTACTELPSKRESPSQLKCRPKLKRPKTETSNSKAIKLSDDIDEELGHNAKAIGSRNLASCERRRRNKLNQKLFSLRAVVPRLTKELQMQVEDMQNDILSLRINKHFLFEDKHVDEASSSCARNGTDAENSWHDVPIYRVLELSVSNLEENLYHFEVCCENGPRVLVQLTKALEALKHSIINANIASMGNLVLNTAVFKVASLAFYLHLVTSYPLYPLWL